jgi:hypothetical protein
MMGLKAKMGEDGTESESSGFKEPGLTETPCSLFSGYPKEHRIKIPISEYPIPNSELQLGFPPQNF